MWSVDIFILGKARIFRHFTVKKTSLPCLLRGSLAYRFSGLHMWSLSSHRKVSCTAGIKGSETFFKLNLSEKIESPPAKQCSSFPLVTGKCCCLSGKLGKHIKFLTFFVYKIDEIHAILSILEPSAQETSHLYVFSVFFHYVFSALKDTWGIYSYPASSPAKDK